LSAGANTSTDTTKVMFTINFCTTITALETHRNNKGKDKITPESSWAYWSPHETKQRFIGRSDGF
jgi:hypothetical protein